MIAREVHYWVEGDRLVTRVLTNVSGGVLLYRLACFGLDDRVEHMAAFHDLARTNGGTGFELTWRPGTPHEAVREALGR